VQRGDMLDSASKGLFSSDIILGNPSLATVEGSDPTRDDLTCAIGNKQLAFPQRMVRRLKDGGGAASMLPDKVLFEADAGADTRRDRMDVQWLHTLPRLPTGILCVQGVKTNVGFFEALSQAATGGTKEVWIYGLGQFARCKAATAFRHWIEF